MTTALYKMHANKYLGDCFVTVTNVEQESADEAGLTRPEIVCLIKTTDEVWRDVATLEQLRSIEPFSDDPVVRVGSECMFGMFGDTHCDCEPERRGVLKEMSGLTGLYIHLPQEAQGQGLYYKTQELHLQTCGFMPSGEFLGQQSQPQAAKALTGDESVDRRSFGVVSEVLEELGMRSVEFSLISKSPSKLRELRECGVDVTRLVDTSSIVTAENLGEYLTKWLYKGYSLDDSQTKQVTQILRGSDLIPARGISLVTEAKLLLGSDEDALMSRVKADRRSRDDLVGAILNPSNEALHGPLAQMLHLLETGAGYDEYQYELILDDELDSYVRQNLQPEGDVNLWYEANQYFIVPDAGAHSRDLKLRSTYNLSGGFRECRLIHKIELSPHLFRIKTITFGDEVMRELLTGSVFADYEQRVVESMTYPFSYLVDKLKIIVKRYAGGLRTLSVEGREREVRAWRSNVEDQLDKRLRPVERDARIFGPKVNGIFRRDEATRLEFAKVAEYSGILYGK